MALKTAGTSTTTVLSALAWNTAMDRTDLAALNALVSQYEKVNTIKRPTPVITQGLVHYPERGSLKILPGDYLAVDPVSGYFIIIDAHAMTGGSFVHS